MTELSARFAAKVAAYTDAWCRASAEDVAAHFAAEAEFVINRGDPWVGRSGIAEMAEGFFRDLPDLVLVSDGFRLAEGHAINLWHFMGHHAEAHTSVHVSGWEEWDLDADLRITASRGWYDATDYTRQVTGG